MGPKCQCDECTSSPISHHPFVNFTIWQKTAAQYGYSRPFSELLVFDIHYSQRNAVLLKCKEITYLGARIHKTIFISLQAYFPFHLAVRPKWNWDI